MLTASQKYDNLLPSAFHCQEKKDAVSLGLEGAKQKGDVSSEWPSLNVRRVCKAHRFGRLPWSMSSNKQTVLLLIITLSKYQERYWY